jgi:hypothetical protein
MATNHAKAEVPVADENTPAMYDERAKRLLLGAIHLVIAALAFAYGVSVFTASSTEPDYLWGAYYCLVVFPAFFAVGSLHIVRAVAYKTAAL